jgi:hypothetical protein
MGEVKHILFWETYNVHMNTSQCKGCGGRNVPMMFLTQLKLLRLTKWRNRKLEKKKHILVNVSTSQHTNSILITVYVSKITHKSTLGTLTLISHTFNPV